MRQVVDRSILAAMLSGGVAVVVTIVLLFMGMLTGGQTITAHPSPTVLAVVHVITATPEAPPSPWPTRAPPTAAPTKPFVLAAYQNTFTPSPTLVAPATYDTRAHIISADDTLSGIAAQYAVSMDLLMQINGLSDARSLVVGQALAIPLPTLTPTVLAYDPRIIPTPAPATLPEAINGVPLDELIFIDDDTRANIRAIAEQGHVLGRDPRAFSKLGDSTIENPHFLTRFDGGPFNLGDYDFMLPMLTYYAGSYSRQGIAVQRGLNSWVVFDALWGRDRACLAGEGPLACELRVYNPSVIFIRIGTNDRSPDGLEENLRAIITYVSEQGVIPILGTKGDQREGGDWNNAVIRQVATEMHIPLFDFHRLTETMQDGGITEDGVHLTTFFTHDYTQPYSTYTGYGAHNLLALLTLDQVWREVFPLLH